MNTDKNFSIYYEITKKYIQLSEEHSDFMKPIEDMAPQIVPMVYRRI